MEGVDNSNSVFGDGYVRYARKAYEEESSFRSSP